MPLMGRGASDGGAAASEKKRQANLDTGMADIAKTYSKFDQNFYDKRGQDYTNYATPQVMQDYRNTKNQLAFALARNGNLGSSADVNSNAALTKTLATNTNQIANNAQDQENQLRDQVQTSRANVTNQLISSGDPSVANESAQIATAGLGAPGTFQPLGNLFSDFSQTYLANQNARAFDPTVKNLWSNFSSSF